MTSPSANTAPVFYPEYDGLAAAHGAPHYFTSLSPSADGYFAFDFNSQITLARLNRDLSVDPMFGGPSGLLIGAAIGQPGFEPASFVVTPSGSLVVAGTVKDHGQVELVGLTRSGHLDTSFGKNGFASLTADGPGWQGAAALVQQPDGRLVVAAYDGPRLGGDAPGTLSLMRLQADGTPDLSFGNHGTVHVGPALSGYTRVWAHPDGAVTVCSTETIGVTATVTLRRYLADGTPAVDFGVNGVATISYQEAEASSRLLADAMVVQPDGKIVLLLSVVGSELSDQMHGMLARLNLDGGLDTSFGAGGTVTLYVAPNDNTWTPPDATWLGGMEFGSLHLNRDGSFVVTGTTSEGQAGGAGFTQIALMKLTAAGRFDPSFNGDGRMTVGTTDPGQTFVANGIVYDDAGDLRLFVTTADRDGSTHPVQVRIVDGQLDVSTGTPVASSAMASDYVASGGPVVLAPNLSIADRELDSTSRGYAGAILTLERVGGAVATDRFGAADVLRFDDGRVQYAGVDLGSVTNRDGTLRIAFNTAALPGAVERVLQSITYEPGAAFADGTHVQLKWTLNDGNTGMQGSGGPATGSLVDTVTLHLAPTLAPWLAALLPQGSAAMDEQSYRHQLESRVPGGRVKVVLDGAYSASQQAIILEQLQKLLAESGLSASDDGVPLTVRVPVDGATDGAYRLVTPSGGSVFYAFTTEDTAVQSARMLHLMEAALGLAWTAEGSVQTDLERAALQYLYGPDPQAHAGDDIYRVAPDSANFIWDGGGQDTVTAEGLNQDVTIHLQPGAWDSVGSRGAAITAAGQVTINYGTVIENATGGSGSDWLSGTAGPNVLQGGAGQDHLTGLGGHDRLDGGAGIDIAVFAAKRANATVNVAGGSGTVVMADGSSTLASVERLHFSDGDVAIDPGAGQLYRLYQAAFGRPADPSGFGYWLAAQDGGTSLDAIAATFLASPEFERRYGKDVSDAQFLTNLYQNVLHRAPDDSGYAFWIGKLDDHAISRTGILLQFTDSPENTGQLAAVVAQGIDYVPWG